MAVMKDLGNGADFGGVLERLEERRRDVNKYVYLLENLRGTKVSEDPAYQCVFESFYVIRFKDEKWLKACFDILEREKENAAVCFRRVLTEMREKTRRMEASFSSKIVATINPEKPVWDRWVLHNLGLKKVYGYGGGDKYLERCVARYHEICEATSAIVERGPGFRRWVSLLDAAHPEYASFTDTKKLDLFLWLSGRPSAQAKAQGTP